MCEGTDITLKGYLILYRVSQEVSDLGWVDLDFGCSAICPILPGLMRARERGRESRAVGQDEWNIQIKVNLTQSETCWDTLYT